MKTEDDAIPADYQAAIQVTTQKMDLNFLAMVTSLGFLSFGASTHTGFVDTQDPTLGLSEKKTVRLFHNIREWEFWGSEDDNLGLRTHRLLDHTAPIGP